MQLRFAVVDLTSRLQRERTASSQHLQWRFTNDPNATKQRQQPQHNIHSPVHVHPDQAACCSAPAAATVLPQ